MKYQNSKSGFSLLELLVATALFSFVMIISVTSLLTIIDGNRKAQALKLAMNNLNFALEGMSRTIRVGTSYHCSTAAGPVPSPPPLTTIQDPSDCSGGGRLFAFEKFGGNPSTGSDQYVYRFVEDSEDPALARGWLERSTQGGASGTFIPITAPEVDINTFVFYVDGEMDLQQPRVIITLEGVAGKKARVETTFTLQTMVSQRILDLP